MIRRFQRERYPLAYLLAGPDEAKVQRDVLDWLAYRGVFALPIDAGARRLRGRALGALRAARTRFADIVLAGPTGAAVEGFPDILGVLPGGRALFVEVKAPCRLEQTGRGVRQLRAAGQPTAAQVAFLEAAQRIGALACIAWATSDVEGALAGR